MTFPYGQKVLNKEVPGVTKASILAALPDVGAAQDNGIAYNARFQQDGNAAVPDRYAAVLISVVTVICVL